MGLADATIPNGITIEKEFQPGAGLSIGSVYMIDGKAVVVHDNEKVGYEIIKGMKLFQKDTVYTQNPGRLLLNMIDGSQLTIGSDSQMTLNQVSIFPKKKTRKSFIRMKKGKARFNVRKFSNIRKTQFKVKTATALIGVRGSDFFIIADQAQTSVTTFDHTKLEVIGLAQPQLPPTLLQDFQRINIAFGDVPSDIEQVSPEEIKSIKKEYDFSSPSTSSKKLENVKKTKKSKDSDSQLSSSEENTESVSSAGTAESSETPEVSSLEPESQEQSTIYVPNQIITPPSGLAQAPDIQEVNISEQVIIEKNEKVVDDQIQQVYEEIKEESKALPDFPGAPPMH